MESKKDPDIVNLVIMCSILFVVGGSFLGAIASLFSDGSYGEKSIPEISFLFLAIVLSIGSVLGLIAITVSIFTVAKDYISKRKTQKDA